MKNVRPDTKVIESTYTGRGIVRLARARTGEYYVEFDMNDNGLHQSTDFDDFDKAAKVYTKLAELVGEVAGLMYSNEFRRV